MRGEHAKGDDRRSGRAEEPPEDASEDMLPFEPVTDAPVRPALERILRPRFSRAQLLAALLCGVVGFALVVQLRQNQGDELANLRQSDLVRLLDEVTNRQDSLETEHNRLQDEVDRLESGSENQALARQAATEAAATQGILAGRLPATGPGLTMTLTPDAEPALTAAAMVNLVSELRNAGAEAIQVGGNRVTLTSSFTDISGGVALDGVLMSLPTAVLVIGDPTTLQPALEIPGGALAVLRGVGVSVSARPSDKVEISAVRDLGETQYAQPMPTPSSD